VGLARLSVAPFAATLLKGATSVGEIADVASEKTRSGSFSVKDAARHSRLPWREE
jgi:hypothetical protein